MTESESHGEIIFYFSELTDDRSSILAITCAVQVLLFKPQNYYFHQDPDPNPTLNYGANTGYSYPILNAKESFRILVYIVNAFIALLTKNKKVGQSRCFGIDRIR